MAEPPFYPSDPTRIKVISPEPPPNIAELLGPSGFTDMSRNPISKQTVATGLGPGDYIFDAGGWPWTVEVELINGRNVATPRALTEKEVKARFGDIGGIGGAGPSDPLIVARLLLDIYDTQAKNEMITQEDAWKRWEAGVRKAQFEFEAYQFEVNRAFGEQAEVTSRAQLGGSLEGLKQRRGETIAAENRQRASSALQDFFPYATPAGSPLTLSQLTAGGQPMQWAQPNRMTLADLYGPSPEQIMPQVISLEDLLAISRQTMPTQIGPASQPIPWEPYPAPLTMPPVPNIM